MPTILMFVVLMLPGHPPVKHHEPVPSLDECLAAVHDILVKGVEGNISIQAGCVVQSGKAEGT